MFILMNDGFAFGGGQFDTRTPHALWDVNRGGSLLFMLNCVKILNWSVCFIMLKQADLLCYFDSKWIRV